MAVALKWHMSLYESQRELERKAKMIKIKLQDKSGYLYVGDEAPIGLLRTVVRKNDKDEVVAHSVIYNNIELYRTTTQNRACGAMEYINSEHHKHMFNPTAEALIDMSEYRPLPEGEPERMYNETLGESGEAILK
jgi:hypothetical protein